MKKEKRCPYCVDGFSKTESSSSSGCALKCSKCAGTGRQFRRYEKEVTKRIVTAIDKILK